ncbi:zinc-binding dehydrogenase, partial [Klebsiella pneumoniae]|uniref:zinc-binding dehydrogenase n=1 Tax=Klebsiella pneumoniae TaxID=573 RepID=UPI0021D2A8D0
MVRAQLIRRIQTLFVGSARDGCGRAVASGASLTDGAEYGGVFKQVFAIVGEDGVDCAIEEVGIPATWNMCQDIVKPGGHIAVVGVHGQSVDFKLEKLWIKNLAITTG